MEGASVSAIAAKEVGKEGAAVLQLEGVSKDFGAIRALSEIDLTINAGDVVGLMGDNGAGKSTLVKIIAGNFHPTHGIRV
jgi:simple sugar transport system ATP-binding protein